MYPSRPSAAGYADATRVASLLTQRPPWSDRSHPDQLLVHLAPHVSDLLLQAAGQDLGRAADHVGDEGFGAATALVVRATRIVDAATVAVRLLQHATPRDDHIVELALRLSAPATSPGWRGIRKAAICLDTGLNVALTAAGTDLSQGLDPTQPPYRLLEAVAGLDLAGRAWRDQHHTLAAGLTPTGSPVGGPPDHVADPRALFPSLAITLTGRARESA